MMLDSDAPFEIWDEIAPCVNTEASFQVESMVANAGGPSDFEHARYRRVWGMLDGTF